MVFTLLARAARLLGLIIGLHCACAHALGDQCGGADDADERCNVEHTRGTSVVRGDATTLLTHGGGRSGGIRIRQSMPWHPGIFDDRVQPGARELRVDAVCLAVKHRIRVQTQVPMSRCD